MKKLLLGISAILILSAPSYAIDKSAMIKLGTATGVMDTDTPYGDEDLEVKMTTAFEYFFRLENGIDIGAGIAYEKHELRSSKFDYGVSDINSYPIYGLLRYRFKTDTDWTPYIYGNLGYASIDEDGGSGDYDMDGGTYVGAGVGIEYIENFGAEIGWARTYMDGSYNGYDFDPVSDLFKMSLTIRLDH